MAKYIPSNDFLQHYAKGTEAANHRYIRKEGDRYIYPEDVAGTSNSGSKIEGRTYSGPKWDRPGFTRNDSNGRDLKLEYNKRQGYRGAGIGKSPEKEHVYSNKSKLDRSTSKSSNIKSSAGMPSNIGKSQYSKEYTDDKNYNSQKNKYGSEWQTRDEINNKANKSSFRDRLRNIASRAGEFFKKVKNKISRGSARVKDVFNRLRNRR